MKTTRSALLGLGWGVVTALILGGLAACTSQEGGTPQGSSAGGGPAITGPETWSGTASDDGGTLKTAFVLSEDAGVLSGVHLLYDPTTGAAVKAGGLTGQRTGQSATWTTWGGLTVNGAFNGNQFGGTATWPGVHSLPARVTTLHLTRGGGE